MKGYFKTAAKTIQAVLLSFMLVMPVGLTGSSRVAAQSQYCAEGFFQYANNGDQPGLKKLDPTTGSYIWIGDGVSVNAIGYNTIDGYIYGLAIGNSNLTRVNADGTTTNIGQPVNASNPAQTLDSQLSGEDLTVGDVSGGKLYAMIGGNSGPRDMFVIDIASNTFTRLSLNYPSNPIDLSGDMVILGNYAYSVDGNGTDNGTNLKRFMRIDLTTGVVSTMYTTNFGTNSNTFGAQWIAKDTDGTYRMFAYENNTGRIYEIVNFQGTGPISFQLMVNPTAENNQKISSNDGASCPDAPVPDFPIKAVDDSDVTDIDVPVDVNWIDNDDEATDGNFVLNTFDTTSVNGGTITDNGDGTFHYTPPAGFTGVDTFTYKICLTGIVGEPICDTATVTITIVGPKLNLEKLVDEVEHQAGDVVTYTINYSNSGDGVANNAILTETIPANTKYAGADLGEDWSCNNGDQQGLLV